MRAMNEIKPLGATPLSKPSYINATEEKNSNSTDTFIKQSYLLEKNLIDSLQPYIENTLILTPSHYQTLLNEARGVMDMYAQHSDVLKKGAALLGQEQALRHFLNVQRTLLLGV
jgi:hypothetical protein